MNKLEIQIQIRKTVKPSTRTPNHCRSFNLSLFDEGVPRAYIPVLLHYLPNSIVLNREDGVDVQERCDKLQKSLAETLTKFYPLAGRYRKDDLTIQCNDEGVEYVETKVNADLVEFLHQAGSKIELLNDDFLPQKLIDPSSCPLLGIQVNIFNCGGLVMGIQMSHILADAFTLATFLNEWAQVSQTGTTQGCLSSFGHLSSLYPKKGLPIPEFSPYCNSSVITRRFVFDALAITKIKDKIDSSVTFTKPTRVVVIMSLIWKVLVSVSSVKHGHSRYSSLVVPINLRGKLNVPSAEHALGNFCIAVICSTCESNQSRKELNDFVNLVGTTLRETSIGIGKASIDDDITSMFGNDNTLGQKGEDIYFSTSWCRLPWYEVDFGWGKPFWVSNVACTMSGLINLIDTKTSDGIEAWVSLEENDMIEFERDLDILTFCPPQNQQLIPQFGQK